MTAAELIEALRRVPPDAKVYFWTSAGGTETVGGVDYDEHYPGRVYLESGSQ